MRFIYRGLHREPVWTYRFPYRFLFNHHHGKGIFYCRKQAGFPEGAGRLSYARLLGWQVTRDCDLRLDSSNANRSLVIVALDAESFRFLLRWRKGWLLPRCRWARNNNRDGVRGRLKADSFFWMFGMPGDFYPGLFFFVEVGESGGVVSDFGEVGVGFACYCKIHTYAVGFWDFVVFFQHFLNDGGFLGR